jgi:cyclophilin family peptidyl-prolyl cis-trans isomerase
MRFKMFVVALLALFVSGEAIAQQQPQRRPPQPQNTVPPIFVAPRIVSRDTLVAPALTPENSWVLDLTSGGRVVIQLRPDLAPNTVARIRGLTQRGFYNGLTFHRVIEGFMAQGGDPAGNGTGESDLPDLAAEFNDLPHLRGAVAMARTADPNSANSQFYIMFVPRLGMDREYTVFGRVVSGMQFVDAIQRGEPPANPTRIVRASIGSDNVPPPTPEEVAALAAPRPPAQPLPVLQIDSLTSQQPVRRRQQPAQQQQQQQPQPPR